MKVLKASNFFQLDCGIWACLFLGAPPFGWLVRERQQDKTPSSWRPMDDKHFLPDGHLDGDFERKMREAMR